MDFIKKNYTPILLIAIALNVLLVVYIAFFKRDALWVETLKSGGSENFQLVEKLYQNENYQKQQTTAIQQAIDSFNKQAASTGANPSN